MLESQELTAILKEHSVCHMPTVKRMENLAEASDTPSFQKSNEGPSLGPLEGGYSSRTVILLLVIATEAFRSPHHG